MSSIFAFIFAALLLVALGETVAFAEGQQGQPCSVNQPCVESLYCNYPQGDCGESKKSIGECSLITELCLKVYRPVCGCDAKSYGNVCEAASKGVSLRHEGRCEDKGGYQSR